MPYVLILIAGGIGFVSSGLYGLVIGIIIGYLLALLIGQISISISGGLVPQKERKKIIDAFLEKELALAKAYTKLSNMSAIIEYIDSEINSIYKESAEKNKFPANYCLSYQAIKAVFDEKIASSVGKENEYYIALRDTLLAVVYPSHT